MNTRKKTGVRKGPRQVEAFKAVFTPGQWEARAARGHDFFEGAREGAFLHDENGTRYLDCDCGGGMYNLGRAHPRVREALKRAARETDQGNFVLLSREKADLGERLSRFLPAELPGAFFSVSRGEAVDVACKLARGNTGRKELVTVDGGFYGQTGFALSLSERRDGALFGTLIPEIRKVPFGNMRALEEAVTRKTAAVFMEPVQAENHCRSAPSEYFRLARELCTKTGAYLAFDETQTGMGRTGKKFAFEHHGIAPDVLVIGEALGAGYFPITATCFAKKAQKLFNDHPLIHLSTFGGHDVGCRVACAALDAYDDERPWDSAGSLGSFLMAGLDAIREANPTKILSVAGSGLLLSINMAGEGASLMMCRALRARGVFAMPGSVARNTVVLRPPLTITRGEAEMLLAAVKSSMGALQR